MQNPLSELLYLFLLYQALGKSNTRSLPWSGAQDLYCKPKLLVKLMKGIMWSSLFLSSQGPGKVGAGFVPLLKLKF